MDTLVTPDRKMVWAFRAAFRVVNSALAVPRPILTPGMAGWPKDRWQCPSMSPGMIHRPVASMTRTLSLSSRFRPGGIRPTLVIRFPWITTASFSTAEPPEPSIKVPLRMTVVCWFWLVMESSVPKESLPN